MFKRWYLFILLALLPASSHAETVTVAQQQAARDKIVQLTSQKQQEQAQIANNNTKIAQNNTAIMRLMFKMGAIGIGNISSTGLPTDINAAIQLSDIKDEIRRLKKENQALENQNKALEAEMAQIDNEIGQQSSILTKPTKADLENRAQEYDQTIKNHEDYINWLRGKGKPQQEIDDAIRNKQNDEMRQNQIKQQIKDGDYREPFVPPTPAPKPPGQQGALPSGPSTEQLTSIIQNLQNQLHQLQSGRPPPPGWSPVGESVASPYKPSVESQLASSQAAQQDIDSRNEWEQAQHQEQIAQLQNQIAQLQQALQNGGRPPPGFDWNSWLQANSIPPQPTGGSSGWSEGSSSSSESGHSHNPDGSDAGSASDIM